MTPEEILEAIEMINEAYANDISNIKGMRTAIENFLIDGTPFPQAVLDERIRLQGVRDAEILNLNIE